MARTKVLIVDDSALMRQVLTAILSRDKSLEVVGTAPDPYVAWEKIHSLAPDVVTLDVEMPRMDGLTFLEKLMRAHPMPVLMISSLTERGCQTAVRALQLGAVDIVSKPRVDVVKGTEELAGEIVGKVKTAAMARLRRRAEAPAIAAAAPPPERLEAAPAAAGAARPMPAATHKVIAIGASTGGTEALRTVLTRMPADAPGIVVVQHMPAGFTRAFAERLDGLCRIRVSEARDGDRVLAGHALIAPGDLQMEVTRSGAAVTVKVAPGERVNHHRPSVDVLFHSCARMLGANAVALILTGMGNDGARGMLAMHDAGARTAAQDEATSIVFGMPREAIALGGVDQVVALGDAAQAVLRMAS